MRHPLILVVLACVATLSPGARADVRFDAPLIDGTSVRYVLETSRTMHLDAPAFPGGGQQDAWTQRTEVTIEVTEADEQGASLRLTVDRVRVEQSSSRAGEAWYDTAPSGRQEITAPMEIALADALAGVTGTVCTIEVDADRRITRAAWARPNDARLSRDARSLRERALGRDRVIELVQPLLRPVGAPTGITIGETWEHGTQERSALGTLAVTSVHTYERDRDGLAEFAMTGAITIESQGLGGDIDVERDTFDGAVLWDSETAMAREVRSHLDVRYSLAIEPPMSVAIEVRERLRRADEVTEDNADDLNDLLATAIARFDQPAIAAAVVSSQEVLAIGVAGVRVRGSNAPVTVDDAFHLGSCTKAMTAVLLMNELQRHDGVGLDTTLREVFTDWAGTMHPRYANATLRELLGHTAGVPAFTSGASAENEALRGLPDDPKSARAAFAERLLIVQDDAPWAPDADEGEFVYSNGGYGLAAAVTEHLSGRDWETLMQERLFAPLGMDHAGFGWPADPNNPEAQPRGHYGGLGSLAPQPIDDAYELQSAIDPAGDAHATIGGWARFAQDRLRVLKGSKSHVLGAGPTMDLMTPRESATYAGGWIVVEIPELGTAYAHDGSAGTFYSSVWLLPERDRAVVIVTNAGTGQEACEGVRGRLLRRYAE